MNEGISQAERDLMKSLRLAEVLASVAWSSLSAMGIAVVPNRRQQLAQRARHAHSTQ